MDDKKNSSSTNFAAKMLTTNKSSSRGYSKDKEKSDLDAYIQKTEKRLSDNGKKILKEWEERNSKLKVFSNDFVTVDMIPLGLHS